MAVFLPPPGTYLQDLNYAFSGSADGALDFGGISVTSGVSGDLYYNLPVALWVTNNKVLGGNLALTAIAPIGWKDVSAGASLAVPGGAIVSGRVRKATILTWATRWSAPWLVGIGEIGTGILPPRSTFPLDIGSKAISPTLASTDGHLTLPPP
jgi:hypothetical protein